MEHLKKIDEAFLDLVEKFKSKTNKEKSKLKIGILYSGGVDSSVLLYLANKYKNKYNFEITILHVCFTDVRDYNNILYYIKGLANGCNVELKTSFCDLKNRKSGIKLEARRVIKQMALNCNCELVLSAHHANDQIETFLLRLLDRSSLYGLKGMEEIITYKEKEKSVILGKPFLKIFKNDLYEYAEINKIKYFEDETNLDINISKRNYIRNIVIPLLENKFDLRNLLDVADMIREKEKNKNDNLQKNIDIYSGKWAINDFINLSLGNRIFVIREYFAKVHGYSLNKEVINNLKRELSSDLTNLYVNLKNGFIVTYNHGHIECEQAKKLKELI